MEAIGSEEPDDGMEFLVDDQAEAGNPTAALAALLLDLIGESAAKPDSPRRKSSVA